MKRALISPEEPVFDYSDPPVQIGVRVVEVAFGDFPVAPPLFWTDCPDDIVADQFAWLDGVFYPKPPPPPLPPIPQVS